MDIFFQNLPRHVIIQAVFLGLNMRGIGLLKFRKSILQLSASPCCETSWFTAPA